MRAYILILTVVVATFNSCSPVQKVVVVKDESLNSFTYFYITPTEILTSSAGGSYGRQYYSTTKTINPADVISGVLLKKGLIRLPELKQDLLDQTFIVNYGESGRKSKGLGYSIEVTIQFIEAETSKLISTCTAEGMGQTEADDIRIAINHCLEKYK